MRQVIEGWHASIGKAILESWGLPEELQHAVEHQDELDAEQDGDVSMTDVLIAAKLLAKGETDGAKFPALRRVGRRDEGRREADGAVRGRAQERAGVVERVTAAPAAVLGTSTTPICLRAAD